MRLHPHHREQGVVLVIALVVLIVLTLTGLSLVRSVSTSLMVAGNMAFQQAATMTADRGTEAAITWLQSNNSGGYLDNSDNRNAEDTNNNNGNDNGYIASWQPQLNPGETWDAYWTRALASSAKVLADNEGYSVAYVIQRLCLTTGPQSISNPCAQSQSLGFSSGGSKGTGVVQLRAPSQRYYRITARAAGPRNSTSYIQVVVAL